MTIVVVSLLEDLSCQFATQTVCWTQTHQTFEVCDLALANLNLLPSGLLTFGWFPYVGLQLDNVTLSGEQICLVGTNISAHRSCVFPDVVDGDLFPSTVVVHHWEYGGINSYVQPHNVLRSFVCTLFGCSQTVIDRLSFN